MKKFLTLCFLTAVVFGILTFATAKVETPFDGNDTYGFPSTFFKRFSGMTSPPPTVASETYYVPLLIDIVVAFIVAFLIWIGYVRWRATAAGKGANQHLANNPPSTNTGDK